MAEPLDLPDRVRWPATFDPALLAADLERLSASGWIEHFLTERYEGTWDVIPLRGPRDADHPAMMIATTPGHKDFADTQALALCPYFQHVIGSFEAELRAVRLLRLTPGSFIKEHTDHEYTGDDGTIRFHVPVVTNPDVVFLLNGRRVVMDAGSAWVLRLIYPHSVANRGQTDRVHMLVDAVMTPRLEKMLRDAAYLPESTAVA
ncbi:MAG: aspartyl/asparaginyl beta-hydroxylase domain-containing protein [Alphaproteobacteria bacterium]|nr:aspartyl/asparaginyl beta-hydroxylase domain-containing protein [Alphaproteobacteria bacterium]MBV9694844.1 aspartyl/asparaginyl beta-hydroxylase domain-containing protein [Alphaproteobacteria bacterium]